MALQYLMAPLAKAGLLPTFISSRLGVNQNQGGGDKTEGSCCKPGATCSDDTNNSSKTVKDDSAGNSNDASKTNITHITTVEEYRTILSSNKIVFVKFTAEWCKPCKNIHPFYSKIATTYSSDKKKIKFVVVDVDELEEVAAECSIAMMPTFWAFQNGKRVTKYAGSDKEKLEGFVKGAL
eukprot:CAMPEP_0198264560 /NCGR_PEP_ID=MMETSP1447-20131203/16222_1 /TAXON_ID=420782 /ORGANISM="Chaetoceros dichaeta, Strain CCMP1751" /LENGTH=179 /DNA_ID=CAMNT_0043953543 /DNA_START=142 /DNA_END=681 /DNA_ORIENTATION=+